MVAGRSAIRNNRVLRGAYRTTIRAAREIRITYRGRSGTAGLGDAPAPLVIGGTGGSGTRVFAAIARTAGFHMGGELNVPLDSLPIFDFYRSWLARYVDVERPLSASESASMASDFDRAVVKHRAGIPTASAAWGMKNPRSMLFLPHLVERFPDLRYLHVVRDGRDIAIDPKPNNQVDAATYAPLIMAGRVHDHDSPDGVAAFWSDTNLAARELGQQALGDRYLMVRLEDLCSEPEATVRTILEFLDALRDADAVHAAAANVSRPPTLGRWRDADADVIAQMEQAGRPALEALGYLDAGR